MTAFQNNVIGTACTSRILHDGAVCILCCKKALHSLTYQVSMRVHLPLLCENSTAKTAPVGPTMSDTWETLVPEAAPRYRTLPPGLMWMLSTPAKTDAASFDLKGFHTLYSVFSPSAASTLILFSLYTLQACTLCGSDMQGSRDLRHLHCFKSQTERRSKVLDYKEVWCL